jgi:hypothetical protein
MGKRQCCLPFPKKLVPFGLDIGLGLFRCGLEVTVHFVVDGMTMTKGAVIGGMKLVCTLKLVSLTIVS